MHYLSVEGRAREGGIWLCLDEIDLIPHKPLRYSFDPPALAVSWQSVSLVFSSDTVDDD